MVITIISVGLKPDPEIARLIATYEQRLPRHVRIVWRFLKRGSNPDPIRSVVEESESILSTIPAGDFVILLDETGSNLTSEQFSDKMYNSGRNVTLIIGGAYGVSTGVKKQANLTIAFGAMVFPHQLMRVIVIEQIYRGYCIFTGHPYHHVGVRR